MRLWRRYGRRPRFLSSKGQDRWIVTEIFPGLRGGFFLEIGAGNGFTGSDTFVLENDHAWQGICVEPHPRLFHELSQARRCICVNACIDDGEREIEFVLDDDKSGIVGDDTDNNARIRGKHLDRRRGEDCMLRLYTRRIGDVLKECHAPKIIHYVSIDVEGSEERIIRSFPFGEYQVLSITVERPTPVIHEQLVQAGLQLVRHRWHDGFYVANAGQAAIAPPRWDRKRF